MDFKDAWRAAGNPAPGNTTWSADVDGRPVFTAWRNRDFSFDKHSRRSTFRSPPGDWVKRGEGQSWLRRAREAMHNGWVCQLIVLNGKTPWEKVESAEFDELLYAVRFTEVLDDGTIRGKLFTRTEFLQLDNGTSAK
ncbi:MAG: hypothetical protein ACREX4_21760 [Gammaproteobacteria bacterium]